MTNESITIILPIPNQLLQPNCMIGSLGGRLAKSSAVKKQRRLAKEAIEDAEVETMPWPRVMISVEFYHKDKRRRDTDNADGSLKSAYDGIVDSGIVQDDAPEYMTRSEPSFHVDREFPRVEITLVRTERIK